MVTPLELAIVKLRFRITYGGLYLPEMARLTLLADVDDVVALVRVKGWWHPITCTNEHDEDGNCLDSDGSITGWREEHPELGS